VLQEIVSEVLTVMNLARIETIIWLFWTLWWIFWFHKVQGLPLLAEEIAGCEEGLCCMEFKQTPLLNVVSFSSIYSTVEIELYSLQGRKSFNAQCQDRVWDPHSLLSFGHRVLFSKVETAVTWGWSTTTWDVHVKYVCVVIIPLPLLSLYQKCLIYIYVLPEDGPRMSKHVREFIIKTDF